MGRSSGAPRSPASQNRAGNSSGTQRKKQPFTCILCMFLEFLRLPFHSYNRYLNKKQATLSCFYRKETHMGHVHLLFDHSSGGLSGFPGLRGSLPAHVSPPRTACLRGHSLISLLLTGAANLLSSLPSSVHGECTNADTVELLQVSDFSYQTA